MYLFALCTVTRMKEINLAVQVEENVMITLMYVDDDTVLKLMKEFHGSLERGRFLLPVSRPITSDIKYLSGILRRSVVNLAQFSLIELSAAPSCKNGATKR